MQLKYQHTQKAGIPFYLALTVGIVACGSLFISPGPAPVVVYILAPVILLWAILLVSSLTVTINDRFLRVRFGPGAFIKKFSLSEIDRVSPARHTWFWGWGIRWYFSGWLYNIAGFKSVEIILKNGKKARIGTDEPEKLARAINNAIR